MDVLTLIGNILLLVASICLIGLVLLQPGKAAGMGSVMPSDDEGTFGKMKIKSYETKLGSLIKIFTVVMFVLAIAVLVIQRLNAK